jgi:hypothetical protein
MGAAESSAPAIPPRQPRVQIVGIEQLMPDPENHNGHTERGMSLLEDQLGRNGLGRSILVDKNNVVIAGNGVLEVAAQLGIERVRIVETDGNEIVAVKRTDVMRSSAQGVEMALADNLIPMRNQAIDYELVQQQATQHALALERVGLTDAELEMALASSEQAANGTIDSSAAGATTDAAESEAQRRRGQRRKAIAVTCPDQESFESVQGDLQQRYGQLPGYQVRTVKLAGAADDD